MSRTKLVIAANALIGTLLLAGIWIGLPARWLVVDVIGTCLAVAALASSAGLASHKPWAGWLARYIAWTELVVGTLVVTLLAISASQLVGSYGPVGAGGAVLLGTIALLVVPYLVVLPLMQLVWLRETS
jgi:hypothetical protein